MKLQITDTEIIITVPLDKNPQLSSTGKSRLLYSSRGTIKTDQDYNGHPISVGLNVMASVRKVKENFQPLGEDL